VVRLPRISNFTDIDALAVEPGVDVSFTSSPEAVLGADLVVLPGTRSTVADLAWLREQGLHGPLTERHRGGQPVLGICGGFQMLGDHVSDPLAVEAPQPSASPGLGLLPVRTRFVREKTLHRPRGEALGCAVGGYEIHHGEVDVRGGEPFLDGCRSGATWGTLWHGTFEHDGFRRAFLTQVAADAHRPDWQPAPGTSFAAARERRIDRLADAVEEHVDTAALLEIIEGGA
jgi:adenosylcobyric acid synthase